MFSSRGLFFSIPCPHPEECHIPQCIFSHDTPVENITPDPIPVASAPVAKKQFDNQNGQRKRRKLGGDDISYVDSTLRDTSSPAVNPPLSSTSISSAKSLNALTRPVSPPPLKRKPQNLNTKSSLPSQNPQTKPTSKPAVPKVVKTEALTPRALKGTAPATWDMRMRLLKALHDQFTRLNTELSKDASDTEEKLVLSDQALITKALNIEEEASSQPVVYANLVKNKILAYKRMSVKQWVEEREKDVAAEKAKEDASVAERRPKAPPKSLESGLSLEDELILLKDLYTPVTNLHQHGYVPFAPSEADIAKAKEGVEASQGWEVCDRCKSRFQVFIDRREEDGAHASGGICAYHWGKPYLPEKSPLNPKVKRERRYKCCGEGIGDSAGCTTAANHVFKVTEAKRMASVMQFVNTPENEKMDEEKAKQPVCIDCEMGYTVYGLELIRLTATTWPKGKEIIDVLVKPLGGILDLNSRFSGVWPKDFADALPYEDSSTSITPTNDSETTKSSLKIVSSPQEARTHLFTHLTPTTPLIGHGLENDLNALRIIHPILIDTALLCPHKAGLPYRNGLKMLMSKYLDRDIQVMTDGEGGVKGHDSREDANAAGELVRWKLKERWEGLRRVGWVFEGGVMVKGKGREQKGNEDGGDDMMLNRSSESGIAAKVAEKKIKEA